MNSREIAKSLGCSKELVDLRRRQGKWPVLNPDACYNYQFDLATVSALYESERAVKRETKLKNRIALKEREKVRNRNRYLKKCQEKQQREGV